MTGTLAALGACGGGGGDGGTASGGTPAPAPTGPPQRGGTVVIMQPVEPRTLDPAGMTNSGGNASWVGNALYGTLVRPDTATGEIHYEFAESLETTDGGTTWILTLRPGLMFTDGTPFDAEAVKYNWERTKDIRLGGPNFVTARHVETATVLDPRTLQVTLGTPFINFEYVIGVSSMNWIASPTALAKGPEEFSDNPVGAGPFVLKSWTRDDRMELVRNPNYYDPQRPYLDAITLRTNTEGTQRLNALRAGNADIIAATNPQLIAEAAADGWLVSQQSLNGGSGMFFNGGTPPFDDPRAREAVIKAIDVEMINQAVFNGEADVVTTMFRPEHELYSEIPITGQDRERAQALFDELAAEGKPLSFTITAFPTTEGQATVESIQAQLATFDNVDAKVEILDSSSVIGRLAARQFQAIMAAVPFDQPDFMFSDALRTGGLQNYALISDPAIDRALDDALTEDVAVRREAMRTIQERVAALNPFLLTTRVTFGVITAPTIGGTEFFYGLGSLPVDRLWRVE